MESQTALRVREYGCRDVRVGVYCDKQAQIADGYITITGATNEPLGPIPVAQLADLITALSNLRSWVREQSLTR